MDDKREARARVLKSIWKTFLCGLGLLVIFAFGVSVGALIILGYAGWWLLH